MDKFIAVSKIIQPTDETIGSLCKACMSLPFTCPPSIFKHFDKEKIPIFCEPILVVNSIREDEYVICSGFRTYQICLELNIEKIQVIDISNLSNEVRIKMCFYASLVPLLMYSSPSTHANANLKNCLISIQNEFNDIKEVNEEFSKFISKYRGRRRNNYKKTAIEIFLNEIKK